MLLAVLFLVSALTRAEIIERFRAEPVTKCDGLVRVCADCPADMRRDYQLPVAGFVADTCQTLYRGLNRRPVRFEEPGIVVYIGDVRTNVTNVVSRVLSREDGTRFTRIYLMAPGFADVNAVRLETAKAFLLAVAGETADDAAALKALHLASPLLRAADVGAELAAWRGGDAAKASFRSAADDERYLKLQRSVLVPGLATREEVLTFASRLYLYPRTYAAPFCGKYRECTFAEAVKYAKIDPYVRLAAYRKAGEIVAFGSGRGERMSAAAEAYSKFLLALAAGEADEGRLTEMLADADAKLKGVLE